MKKLELSWDELWPFVNILNEVCHGLKIEILSKIDHSYEEVYALLEKLSSHECAEDEEDVKKEITFSDNEIHILKRSLHEVALEIEEWEFQTRIGVTLDEIQETFLKILRPFTSLC